MANMIFVVLIIISIFNSNVSLGKASENGRDAVASRIFLGLEVNEGEYPFIARIHDYKGKPKIFCTASIIHKNWVLTAGHCLNDKPQKVTVGTTSANGIDGQTYDIKSTYVPYNYNVSAQVDRRKKKLNHYVSNNDIGLIQLQTPIDLGQPNVETIPLDNTSSDYEEQNVVYVGWGKTQVNAYSPAKRAQFAQGRVISTTDCQKAQPNWVVSSSQHMCILPLFKSTICPGDAGAPLMLYNTNKQIGVANHGTCGSKSPSVFQKISTHYPWIKKTIHKQGDTLSDE